MVPKPNYIGANFKWFVTQAQISLSFLDSGNSVISLTMVGPRSWPCWASASPLSYIPSLERILKAMEFSTCFV